MSLSDALTAATSTMAGTCPVAAIILTLDADEWLALKAALDDKTAMPSAAIAAALTATDHRIAATDVRDHRAGDCPCVIPGGA